MTPAAGGGTLPPAMLDRRNDSGHRVGELHHRAKLSDAEVREIRDMAENRKTARAILEELTNREPPVKVSYHTVRAIIAWRRRVHP